VPAVVKFGWDGSEVDEYKGGDGLDLPHAGLDYGTDDGANRPAPGAPGVSDEFSDACADAICSGMPAVLHGCAWQAEDSASGSSWMCQHTRCATHTPQQSVHAGLTVPAVRSAFQRVVLVAKLRGPALSCRATCESL